MHLWKECLILITHTAVVPYTRVVGTVIVGRDNRCCRRVVVLHNGFLLFFLLRHKGRWHSRCWTRQSLLQEGCGATQWVFVFFAAAQLLLPQLLLPQLLLPQLLCHCTKPTDHSTHSFSTRTKKKARLRKSNRCISDPSEPTHPIHLNRLNPDTSDTCVYAQEKQ